MTRGTDGRLLGTLVTCLCPQRQTTWLWGQMNMWTTFSTWEYIASFILKHTLVSRLHFEKLSWSMSQINKWETKLRDNKSKRRDSQETKKVYANPKRSRNGSCPNVCGNLAGYFLYLLQIPKAVLNSFTTSIVQMVSTAITGAAPEF